MNLIKRGLDWLEEHAPTEPVYVVSANRVLNVTVIEPESRVNREGIRIQNDTFRFLFSTSEAKGITWKRGMKIRRNGVLYETVFSDNAFLDYNDPDLKKIALPVKIAQTQDT